MADSFSKKEREKKRRKRKKEKAEEKERRKEEGNSTPEFMYVDVNGNLTSTPPDLSAREKISIEDIDVSTPKSDKSDRPNFLKDGIVKFFNTEKGYGFITDRDTGDSFFVHIDSLVDPIRENDKVTFEVGKGPKGPVANDVRLVK